MKTIAVNASKNYKVYVGGGLLALAKGPFVCENRAAAVITDENVGALYAQTLCAALKARGFRVCVFTAPNGEEAKSGQTYLRLLSFLAQNRITRRDILCALGGGTVGDLCGFAAASFLRGVEYMQFPTTLLAAVDSSVGGKTAINLPEGKNLAGAFWQPSAVFADTDTFKSLPTETFSDGFGEIVKYAMLRDGLADILLKYDLKDFINGLAPTEEVIARCVEIKAEIVADDEYDRGQRALLNFGHTIGHAAEKLSGYSLSHGQAVSAGMSAVTKAAVKNGICGGEVPETLNRLQRRYGLLEELPYACEELVKAALGDKKTHDGAIDLIVPERVGSCRVMPVKINELGKFLFEI